MNNILISNFNNLPNYVKNEKADGIFLSISEFSNLYDNLLTHKKTFEEFQILKNEIEINSNIINLSKKVAHDIRSPLSTLNLISSKIESTELRELQLAVIDIINFIAEDLLNQTKKKIIKINDSCISIRSLFNLLSRESIIDKIKCRIKFSFQEELNYFVIEKKTENIIYPIINNIINNALEATKNDELIICNFTILKENLTNKLKIEIIDNGKGIPIDILSKIGKEPISFGKENSSTSGSGIALFNAIQDIRKINGDLLINSEDGLGSSFIILLPLKI